MIPRGRLMTVAIIVSLSSLIKCSDTFVSFFREDPIDLESGAQHIMRYSAIAPLLSNGSVSLI